MAAKLGTILKVAGLALVIIGLLGLNHHFSTFEGFKGDGALLGGLIAMGIGWKLVSRYELLEQILKTKADTMVMLNTGQAPVENASQLTRVMNRIYNCTRGLLYHAFDRSRKIGMQDSSIGNMGKLSDLAKFDAPVHSSRVAGAAERHGIKTISTVQPQPFERGVCAGCCLFFAGEYFRNGHDVDKAVAHFKGGAPFEAVVLQAAMKNLWTGITMPIVSHPEFNQPEIVEERHDRAALEVGDVDTGEREAKLTQEQAIDSLAKKGEGVYYLSHSNHATLFIKKGEEMVFYDPNYGLSNVPDVRKFFATEFPSKGTITISSLHERNPGDATNL